MCYDVPNESDGATTSDVKTDKNESLPTEKADVNKTTPRRLFQRRSVANWPKSTAEETPPEQVSGLQGYIDVFSHKNSTFISSPAATKRKLRQTYDWRNYVNYTSWPRFSSIIFALKNMAWPTMRRFVVLG